MIVRIILQNTFCILYKTKTLFDIMKQTEKEVIKIETPNGVFEASFKQPTMLVYKAFLEQKDSDKFKAFENFYNSLVIGTTYKDQPEVQIMFFTELNKRFLNFFDYDFEDTEVNFKVTINEKVFTIAYPNKEQFGKLFNANLEGTLEGLEYIMENLSNDKTIDLSIKEVLSLRSIPQLILFNKQLQLKKK